MLFKKILVTLFAIVISVHSIATNYYVATYGSDANSGTSVNTPLLTVAAAINKVVAGDTIFVRSGTYVPVTTIKIKKSGTVAKHIVLTVYKPDMVSAYSRPVLDFSGMAVSSSNYGIRMSSSYYWDIYGLVIKGAGDNGMLMDGGCAYVKIEFCSFTRNRDSGFQIRDASHHCLILNCDSYENADLGVGTTTNGGNADGFCPKLDVGDSVIFRGCRAWTNSDDGWDGYLKATENGYPDKMTTILEDCWAWHNGYYWLDGSTTTSENGNGIKMGGSVNKNEAHNFVVTRCMSFYNKAKGFDQNNNAGSMYLYNNTSYKNGDLDFGLNSSGVTYATSAVTVVENCTCTSGKGTAFKTGATLSNNIFTAATTNFQSIDTTGISGPRRVDGSLPTLSFMHLVAGSSLIDAGTILPNVSYHDTTNWPIFMDSLGIPFYGAKPDIGCFEFPAITGYTFNDNGSWSAQSKWVNHNMPPASVVSGSTITISPIAGGKCILDKPYVLAPGSTINISSPATPGVVVFVIPGFLTLR